MIGLSSMIAHLIAFCKVTYSGKRYPTLALVTVAGAGAGACAGAGAGAGVDFGAGVGVAGLSEVPKRLRNPVFVVGEVNELMYNSEDYVRKI